MSGSAGAGGRLSSGGLSELRFILSNVSLISSGTSGVPNSSVSVGGDGNSGCGPTELDSDRA